MEKRGKKSEIFLSRSFVPKETRGQFYLITTIIIITIVASLVIVSNYSRERSDIKINYLGEELEIESEKVLDYAVKNNKDVKGVLINFTKTYSKYSSAENLYFLFGNTNEITIAGYKKLNSGNILINTGLVNENFSLNKGEYHSKSFLNPSSSVSITVEGIKYEFSIKSGENFYYIISREIEEDIYILSNSYYEKSVKSICSNGILETGEQCDGDIQACTINGYDGTKECNDQCSGFNSCTTIGFCGDNLVNGNEQCDDGNSINNDSCLNSCLNNICGDGFLNSVAEQCDDGNSNNFDGCSSSCLIELEAVFLANYSDLCKNCGSAPPGFGGGDWWYYNVTLNETGGFAGINVSSRQKCYSDPNSDDCDPVKTDIADKYGTNYISPGGQIMSNNEWVWTTATPMTVTETFNGTDDNGNFVTANYTFTVS